MTVVRFNMTSPFTDRPESPFHHRPHPTESAVDLDRIACDRGLVRQPPHPGVPIAHSPQPSRWWTVGWTGQPPGDLLLPVGFGGGSPIARTFSPFPRPRGG